MERFVGKGKSALYVFMILVLSICLIGCGKKEEEKAHADEGPHGGHVMELGRDHKYHAELVENDDEKSLTAYVLDGNLKETAVKASGASLIITADGKTATYELKSAGGETSSKFSSQDEAMFKTWETAKEQDVKLRISIDGVSFTGEMHHHGH